MLVLLVAWLFLGDVITLRKLAGMLLAILGMVAYGISVQRQQLQLQQALQAQQVHLGGRAAADEEKQQLLAPISNIRDTSFMLNESNGVIICPGVTGRRAVYKV